MDQWKGKKITWESQYLVLLLMLTWSPVFSGCPVVAQWKCSWAQLSYHNDAPASLIIVLAGLLLAVATCEILNSLLFTGETGDVFGGEERRAGLTRDSSARTVLPVLAPVWGSRPGDEVVGRPETGSSQVRSWGDSPPLHLLLLLLLRPLDWSWYCCCSQLPSWARVSWWRPQGWSSFAHFSCLEVCCLFCTSSDGSGTKFWSASLINTEREQFLSGGAEWDNG